MPKIKEPPELVPNSFQHVVSMKEKYAKSGAYKIRTLQITRDKKIEGLGFTAREGDGWSRKDGLFISRIRFGSVFDTCSLVSIGEEIIKIDDKNIRDMNINDALRQLYDSTIITITIKITMPFVRQRAGRLRKTTEPSVSRVEDYKVLNMRIVPRNERHVYVEKEQEEIQEQEEVEE